MKRSIYMMGATFAMIVLAACNKNLDKINIDPNKLSENTVKYEYVFTSAQIFASGNADSYANGIWQSSISYASAMMQQLSSTSPVFYGDKYIYNQEYNAFYWNDQYSTGIRNVVDVIEHTRGNAEKQNLYNIARIYRVWLMQQMTDLYGDVPYAQAGLGYINGLTTPKYDKQQDIYADMLNQLQDAASKLDGGTDGTIGAADVFYGGNLTQWKKFAFSEMLRIAMRMSKVAPDKAQAWAQKAVAGGLMESNDDNALLQHQDFGTANPITNPVGLQLHTRESTDYHLSETFVNFLAVNSDPRLQFFATVIDDPTVSDDKGDTDPAIQLGQPNGYDKSGASATDISNAPNWPGSQNKYSVVNRSTFAREDAPSFILTYAETALLLAEAAQRGWVAGDAAALYSKGVTAAILQLNQTGATLQASDAAAYLTTHPYNAAKGLEMINTQYWVATFSDWLETWANYRRSDYPILTPVNYHGNSTNGTIPRRLTYPFNETIVNNANYRAAVDALSGGDKMTSRVWWDK